MLIDRLQIRLGGRKAAFETAELQEFIDSATNQYGLAEGRDDELILKLALCACYLRLATDSATFFKYTQGTESVDKSMTPKIFMELYQVTWDTIKDQVDGKPVMFQIKKAGSSAEAESEDA